MWWRFGSSLALGFVMAGTGQAAGLNLYAGISDNILKTKIFSPVFASLAGLLILCFVGLQYRSSVEKCQASGELAPSGKASLKEFVDSVMDFLYQLTSENGGKNFLQFFPLLATLFLYILACNLSGLVPGLPPATENFSINLAMGIIAFVAYNWAGIKEHGGSYISQFTGPLLALAPLFLVIEVISHSVRPLSLAFRLLANIFCDHLIVGVFSTIVPLFIPALFLFFGLLVAVVQSFVFALLTAIYINMAISHDH